MNKKERFQAVREKRAPDHMPVWPRVMSQMLYSYGYSMPDVTGQDWYDSDKITKAVLASIKNVDYDVAIPTYVDYGFGVPPMGGKIAIPDKFGIAVGTTDQQPVMTKQDWPRIKKMMASYDVRNADPRMKGCLEVIKNVAAEVGSTMPLVPMYYCGTTAAMFLFRPNEAFLEDMFEDPDWVEEMCTVATDWAIEWISAQYEAGCNSVCFTSETLGTLMCSPKMAEQFNLPQIARLVEEMRKRHNQATWLHIHGNMTNPKAYAYLTKLVKEAKVEGFHFDETKNPPDWIKEKVVDELGVSACIITDGAAIVKGPVEKIKAEVKDQISQIGDGLGLMMAPSCQVLPATPNEHFKAWVDATHEYGTYPLKK
jgi:uroporphyrinogen-III decarboxylase